VDRREIEALRGINRLIKHYSESKDQSRPLSLAVFGPPGSGKSFAVKQIANSILGDTPLLEFNLSQFENPKDLIGAFHQVRDKVLEGTMPIVFWDEFDSREYLWLQYLLAPMQDGKFQEGQITHPIGKCVFVFAGGTCSSMVAFCPPDPETLGKNVPEAEKREAIGRYQHFKLMKGPDFASRLHGYLNVLGPNPLKCTNGKCECLPDLADICFPIRRSLIIRSCQRMKDGERLKIDSGLLTALLEIGEYKHGSRSLEIILSQMKSMGGKGILRSGLPPSEVLSMHINEKEFYEIMTRHLEFRKQSHILAPYVHGSYLSLVDKNKWKVDYMGIYESLSAEIKEDNRVAAERIPKILELIGIEVSRDPVENPVSAREVRKLIDENMEMMAEAEHEGWMEQKLANGWVYGEKRDNERKIHPALIPYGSLHEEDKEKDRNSIRSYPDIVKLAGFRFGRIMK